MKVGTVGGHESPWVGGKIAHLNGLSVRVSGESIG